jgi:hypothetical protein
MVIRIHVGSEDGVTNASISPAHRNSRIVPMMMAIERRPSSAIACPRVRSPGAKVAHAI